MKGYEEGFIYGFGIATIAFSIFLLFIVVPHCPLSAPQPLFEKANSIANCTSMCIQQFENFTKNVYVSEELRNDFAEWCFETCKAYAG